MNVATMQFGNYATITLVVTTEIPLPAAAWAHIGYAARSIEQLAQQVDAVLLPSPMDEDPS